MQVNTNVDIGAPGSSRYYSSGYERTAELEEGVWVLTVKWTESAGGYGPTVIMERVSLAGLRWNRPCYLVELTSRLKELQRETVVLPEVSGTAEPQERLGSVTLCESPGRSHFVSGNEGCLLTKLVKGITNVYFLFLQKKADYLS